MSTKDITETADAEVTTEQLLDRQRGLEARIEIVENEVESLREDFEKVDQAAVTESVVNILINDLTGDDCDIQFDDSPAENRFALQTIDERIDALETTVELLQHQRAEVAE